MIHRFWKLLLIMTAIVLVDQLTKAAVQSNMYPGQLISIIDGFFNISYVRNSGAAFGFGSDFGDWVRVLLFLFLPVVACIWLFYLIIISLKEELLLATSYSLILAGAIGNLIDRFYMGFVVDFLDFYYKSYHFPSFNVADSSITIGAILIVWDYLVKLRNNQKTSSPHGKDEVLNG